MTQRVLSRLREGIGPPVGQVALEVASLHSQMAEMRPVVAQAYEGDAV